MVILEIMRKVPFRTSSNTYEVVYEQFFVNEDEQKAKELRDEIIRYYGDERMVEVTKIDGKRMV